jgi:NADH-quinone oxidoreductase subunit A
MEQYGPLALLIGLSLGLGGVFLFLSSGGLSFLLSMGKGWGNRPDAIKSGTYECGVEPVGDARTRFPVRYYLVALVFVVFDLEAVFIYPWAVTFRDLKATGRGMLAFWEMAAFMGVLMVGLFYLWRRGALDWD